MWPVHTWLPDAHVEAPTGGSVILAAIMLKMGGYGFLRFSLPITPDASDALDWLVISLSLIAVVYIGFVALVQKDMKKLIAYSSIAHMGFVTLGSFLVFELVRVNGDTRGAAMGIDGAMVQMISHGLISGAMFFCVGVLYDRMHTRDIDAYGGVVNKMPIFAAFAVLFAMANSGLPATSGFVGEFLVILSSFRADFWYAFLAAHDIDSGRRVHSVAGEARDLRRGGESSCRRADRRQRTRIPGTGHSGGCGAAAGRVAGAAARCDASDG